VPKIFQRVLAALCAALLAVPAGWTTEPPVAPPRPPKLLVILVVDQFRSDYITAYGHMWSKGLRRLVDQGAWFTEAAYPYMNTVTCAGHATISTGTVPYKHGMILNGWWDRAAGRSVSCTNDYNASYVPLHGELPGGGHSALHLRAPTLAQELRNLLGKKQARVASFSRKARSAIMLAGPDADAVVWLGDERRGIWTTSHAYTKFPFLQNFVEHNPVEGDFHKQWKLTLAHSKYAHRDDAPGERPQPPHWTNQFPHRLKNGYSRPDPAFYEAWMDSPFADDYLARMARAAVAGLSMGRGSGTDLLAISFSTLDGIGHDFGPRSFEVQDTLVRLDASIGGLLDYLDRRVGPENYVVALSSDHGVAEVPEQMWRDNREAGRVPTGHIAEAVEKVLGKHFGNGNGRYIAAAQYTDFYFANGVYSKLLANPAVLEEVIAVIQKTQGISRVFRSDLLPGLRESPDPMERAAALNYFPERSGDLLLVPKENWFFVPGRDSKTVATHGTAHPYDARVPVILYGAGIKPGRYSQPATPADIAPTLATLVGFTMPEATGRVLHEALALPEKNQLAQPDSLLDSPK
jgi:predicted AlkP superfamily pyrophosphatase or phosphodiesterase